MPRPRQNLIFCSEHFGREALCVFEANNWFSSRKVQNGANRAKMVKNILYWSFETILDTLRPLWDTLASLSCLAIFGPKRAFCDPPCTFFLYLFPGQLLAPSLGLEAHFMSRRPLCSVRHRTSRHPSYVQGIPKKKSTIKFPPLLLFLLCHVFLLYSEH